jgi:uncharacterized protein (UPF0147 family)
MDENGFGDVESTLNELKDDATVPKNVRQRIEGVIELINGDLALPIKVSRVLNELEEIVDDVNLQQYTRTQIWNIVSMLEKIK